MTTWTNQLYFGDNLNVLREHIPDASVDLIYLDPPFNSDATYNVLFEEKSGEDAAAQIMAFEDTWHWTIESERAYREVVIDGPDQLGKLLQAMREFLGQNDMMAYLTMMAQRLAELHRVLKPTGSIYLHCDPTASHYLKLFMDAVFGHRQFQNDIIWRRTSAHAGALRYGRNYDSLLFYTKSGEHQWNDPVVPHDQAYLDRFYRFQDERGRFRLSDLTAAGTRRGASGRPWRGVNPTDVGRHWAIPQGTTDPDLKGLTTQEKLDLLDNRGRIYWPPEGTVPSYKRYLDEVAEGQLAQALWTDIRPIGAQARERLSYPTQKPEALLERIINASSNEIDVVLDPFCGCGTAVAVAERLKRRWIGIDITHLAISLMKHRLHDTFGTELSDYTVVGLPEDLESARALAEESSDRRRRQFQLWACSLVDARPEKEGPDGGIDGRINFFDDNSGKAKRIIVQVKSGHVNRGMIATLKGDMEREDAAIGIFITLEAPTEPMRQEAIAAGFYEPEALPGNQYPKVQILTIEQLLDGAEPDYPRFAVPQTFRRAPRQRRQQGVQQSLDT